MTAEPNLPGGIQQLLQQIYDVSAGHDVADFLITDRALADALHDDSGHRAVKEKLLVAEDGEYVDLSLYLDAGLLRRLQTRNPLVDLHHLNLADFCLVVEGISHFLYLAWNARHDKSVTLMELELQAEIDKFVMALHLLSRQGSGNAGELHRRLFDAPRFDPQLGDQALERYRHASLYAGKYCRALYRRFLRRVRRPGMLSELRRFYRLPQSAKIRHIEDAFCAAG